MVNNYRASPVSGGVRRRKTRPPMMKSAGDSTCIRYSSPGDTFGSDANGRNPAFRRYIPGSSAGLAISIGTQLVSSYSSGKFKPGTKIVWEPSCSFTTSGRLFVGFTDNPEVANTLFSKLQAYVTTPSTTTWNAYSSAVRALGSCISFPVWQETNIPFPTTLRRKRFDCNFLTDMTSPDVLDRSMQQSMWVALEGADPNIAVGNFQYHDIVDVEGIHAEVV